MTNVVNFVHAQLFSKRMLSDARSMIVAQTTEGKFAIAYSLRQVLNDSLFQNKELILVSTQPSATTEFTFTQECYAASEAMKYQAQQIGSTLVDHVVLNTTRKYMSLESNNWF